MKNIIAKSKTTELTIQVTYQDSHIIKGFVLVGDQFNKVGAIDYWSTSTLDIKRNDMKKITKGTNLVCCNDFYLDGNHCLTKNKEYIVSMIGEDKESFFIVDDELEAHRFCFSDVPNVWFNFVNDPIVLIDIPKHYNNENGTLYKVAEERGWNSYLFDIVKRLERAEKKGEFITDLEKSKVVIDLWLKESEQC